MISRKQVENVMRSSHLSLLPNNTNKPIKITHSLSRKQITQITTLLVYVYDIIIADNSMTQFDHIKKFLHHTFQVKNIGQLKYFLGLEFAHSKLSITLFQRKYFIDLISDTGLLGSKLVSTPVDPAIKIMHDSK